MVAVVEMVHLVLFLYLVVQVAVVMERDLELVVKMEQLIQEVVLVDLEVVVLVVEQVDLV